MSVTWSDAPEDILVEVLRLAGPRIIGLFGLLSKGSENLQRISTLHAMWEHVRNDCGAFVDTTASLQEQKRSLMMGFNSIENLRQNRCRVRVLLECAPMTYIIAYANGDLAAVTIIEDLIRSSYSDMHVVGHRMLKLRDVARNGDELETMPWPLANIRLPIGANDYRKVLNVQQHFSTTGPIWNKLDVLSWDEELGRMIQHGTSITGPNIKRDQYGSLGSVNGNPNCNAVAIFVAGLNRFYIIDVKQGDTVASFDATPRDEKCYCSYRYFFHSSFLVWPKGNTITIYDIAPSLKLEGASPLIRVPELPENVASVRDLVNDGREVAVITDNCQGYYLNEADLRFLAIHVVDLSSATVRVSTEEGVLLAAIPGLTKSTVGALRIQMDAQFVYAGMNGFIAVFQRRNLAFINAVIVKSNIRQWHSYGTGKLAIFCGTRVLTLELDSENLGTKIKGIFAPVGLPPVEVEYTESTWTDVATSLLDCSMEDLEMITLVQRGTRDPRFIVVTKKRPPRTSFKPNLAFQNPALKATPSRVAAIEPFIMTHSKELTSIVFPIEGQTASSLAAAVVVQEDQQTQRLPNVRSSLRDRTARYSGAERAAEMELHVFGHSFVMMHVGGDGTGQFMPADLTSDLFTKSCADPKGGSKR